MYRYRVSLLTLGVVNLGMVIGTNVASITAQRHLKESRGDMETSMERLASGQRINSAADDAAGMAIANKLEVKVMSLNQGIRNANDGISMIQVAEGGMEEIGNMLARMKELAVQAANETYTAESLTTMDNEYQGLVVEITRIAQTTDFNGTALLSSATTTGIHVGDSADDSIILSFQDIRSAQLGFELISTEREGTTSYRGSNRWIVSLDVADTVKATEVLRITVDGTEIIQAFVTDAETTFDALSSKMQSNAKINDAWDDIGSGFYRLNIGAAPGVVMTLEVVTPVVISATSIKDSDLARIAKISIDQALKQVDDYRADLGSLSKKLDHTVSNLMSRVESQSTALSRIKDADYAVESANLAKAQVLQQAGTAMLAQANASGESVLQLLK